MDFILEYLHSPFSWLLEYLSGRLRFFIATFVVVKLWSIAVKTRKIRTFQANKRHIQYCKVKEEENNGGETNGITKKLL